MPSEFEFTDRTLVALMAAVIHGTNEERGCTTEKAVQAAQEIMRWVEFGVRGGDDADPLYPCAKCGALRTKAEGGTTFTVCDKCWDEHWGGDDGE